MRTDTNQVIFLLSLLLRALHHSEKQTLSRAVTHRILSSTISNRADLAVWIKYQIDHELKPFEYL